MNEQIYRNICNFSQSIGYQAFISKIISVAEHNELFDGFLAACGVTREEVLDEALRYLLA